MYRIETDAQSLLSTIVSTYPHTVWFADIDDTLIDTVKTHKVASNSIAEVLKPPVGEGKAEEIAKRFAEIFQLLVTFHQSTADEEAELAEGIRKQREELQLRIDGCQQEIKQRWGMTKKLSREVLLKLAGEDCGVSLAAEQIKECADSYWQNLESHTICFEDARRLTEDIARVGCPLYLITSSDARLALKENGQFEYNPESSRRFKMSRVEKLRGRGLYYRNVFIGDPVDKPTPEFFEMVYSGVERELRRQLKSEHIIILGDSYEADLQVPISKWNAALGILYRRGQENVVLEKECVISVGDWQVISELLAFL